jgi:hypothetical protein
MTELLIPYHILFISGSAEIHGSYHYLESLNYLTWPTWPARSLSNRQSRQGGADMTLIVIDCNWWCWMHGAKSQFWAWIKQVIWWSGLCKLRASTDIQNIRCENFGQFGPEASFRSALKPKMLHWASKRSVRNLQLSPQCTCSAFISHIELHDSCLLTLPIHKWKNDCFFSDRHLISYIQGSHSYPCLPIARYCFLLTSLIFSLEIKWLEEIPASCKMSATWDIIWFCRQTLSCKSLNEPIDLPVICICLPQPFDTLQTL